MRIVYVDDYYYPQLGYQTAFMTRAYLKLGHEVHLVTSDRYNSFEHPYDSHKKILGERIVKPGLYNEDGINIWRLPTIFEYDSVLWMKGIQNKIKELAPDIVHVIGIPSVACIQIALLKMWRPGFKLIYNNYTINIGSQSRIKFLYPVFRVTLANLISKTANAIVTPADEARLFLHRNCGIPLNKIAVIPHGADDNLFHYDEVARQQIRRELYLEDKFVFIYTGKIDPDKGIHLIIEASIDLARENNNFSVLIVGNGSLSYINGMKQKIKEKKIDDIFLWHDFVPNNELYKLYSAADVAVWPCSVTISTLEAMACNLPVIVSDLPAAIDRINYDNGLFVRNGNVSELKQHMKKLLLSPDLRFQMGNNSRKAIEEHLNWQVIAKQFIDLIEK